MAKAISKKRREIIHKMYGGRCAYCGCVVKYEKMHVDHVIPLYRGWSQLELDHYEIIKGTNKIENLNPSCPSCNISKGTFTIDKWRVELFKKVNRVRRDSTNFRILESFGIVKITNKQIVFHFEKVTIKKQV
tara:strand:- start:142 stop:537 length:396 start_codon:yes stop_codon:yes gene_type:complete